MVEVTGLNGVRVRGPAGGSARRRRGGGEVSLQPGPDEPGGPTAKSFNFASLYDRLGEGRATPSNLWCGDDEARDVVEHLNRDAGYEPVHVGGLETAAAQEGFVGLVFAIAEGGLGPFVYRLGPFVYRLAPPDQL